MTPPDQFRVEPLSDPREVMAWPGGDPYLASDVEPQLLLHAVRAVHDESTIAVAFVRDASHGREHPWITALGDPQASTSLVLDLVGRYGVTDGGGLVAGATTPRSAREATSAELAQHHRVAWGRGEQGAPWDWWWTDEVTVPEPAAHQVRWLETADPAVTDSIRRLLAVASPSHWAPPEHPDVRRWAGIVAPDGALVACVAETLRIPERPHLASVATHPDHRGQGMGGEVTGWITRELLSEGVPLVSLGMYAHNDTARRVYTRLGFRCDYSWFSSGFASIPASAR